MNLANKLTIVRIFLVPFFMIFIAVKDIPYGRSIATAIFIIAALTDKLDGYIARSRNQITKFGKFMDPLADKLLVTAALVSFVELQMIPGWVAIVIISRELAVTGLRAIAASEGLVIAASWWGKIKTAVQIAAILCVLITLNINEIIVKLNLSLSIDFGAIFSMLSNITIYAAVIITIISGIDYFVKNKHVLNTDK